MCIRDRRHIFSQPQIISKSLHINHVNKAPTYPRYITINTPPSHRSSLPFVKPNSNSPTIITISTGKSKLMDWGRTERVLTCAESPRISAISSVFAPNICLLYTSDAADEEDSVDLGGRRI